MDTAITSVFSISPASLSLRLGRPDAPVLLDVRRPERFVSSPRILPGARWCAPEGVAEFSAQYAPSEVVVYCVYGHNVSEDAVRVLRAAGWDAYQLAGGIEGGQDGTDTPEAIARWRASDLPTVTKRADWGVTGERPSRWITRERPKIDRIACPWLIRRFVDPRAEFFYSPADQVFDRAKHNQAVPYDIPGAPVSHAGPLCSFDALLGGFGLKVPALNRLATIIRAADTDQMDLAPQAAGLLSISLGMSSLYADDHAMLEAMLPVYDALYAWCVDREAGNNEGHTWKPAS